MSTSRKATGHDVLVVDDDPGQRSLLNTFLVRSGFNVREAASGKEALDCVHEALPAMVISDVRMAGLSGLDLLRELRCKHPSLPVLLVTAYADIRDAVGAMRDGAVSYLEKPIDLDELVNCVQHAIGPAQNPLAHSALDDLPSLPEWVVAESPAMQKILQEAAIVAPTDSRVLLTGESGSGKEVVAQLIHTWSRRHDANLVTVNCAAIPEALLESELFGHEKGAFTGADRRRLGRFEESNGGTLFLDEIAEMAPALQAKLLRVIQEGIFERVGSNTPIQTDVRVLAATNRDLEAEVVANRFREDLFYRLGVFELHVPPLRERLEDILPLAERFAKRYAGSSAQLSDAVRLLLPLYPWPGNVRELQNAIERATLMARGAMVLPDHLPRRVRESSPPTSAAAADPKETGRMEKMERLLILRTLKEHQYNRTETARALGIGRRTLTYKLQRLRELGFPIDPP